MTQIIGAKPGPYQRKVVALADGYVLVQEVWDTAAPDLPFCSWPRGAQMPPHIARNITMYRKEAEELGLVPKAN